MIDHLGPLCAYVYLYLKSHPTLLRKNSTEQLYFSGGKQKNPNPHKTTTTPKSFPLWKQNSLLMTDILWEFSETGIEILQELEHG